jgi:RNA polymerase-binding transcription factor DksA
MTTLRPRSLARRRLICDGLARGGRQRDPKPDACVVTDDVTTLEVNRGVIMELSCGDGTERLADVRQRLEDERRALESGLVGSTRGIGELDATRGHGETDLAVIDGQRTIDAALESEAVASIFALDAAIARVGDGAYGSCVSCGRAIPEARLVAIPEAARCVACQRDLDRSVGR